MGRPVDIRKIVDFNVDYYEVLGIERGCLPPGYTREEQKKTSEILLKAMRSKMWQAHPDHGGSEEQFKLVTRAQWILENPISRIYWESGGETTPKLVDDATGFEIDWNKIGTYQQGTPADSVGYGLFTKLNERAESLGIVPAFFPTEQNHTYEWDWIIPEKNQKLALALVYDDNDVLRLTGGEDISDALPFKIYWCFPRAALHFHREDKEIWHFKDPRIKPYVFNGKLRGAIYSDYNLLETTHLEHALNYIKPGGKLEKDLASFRDGTLIEQQQKIDKAASQKQWMDTDKVKAADAESLRDTLRMSIFHLTPNPTGADFLDRLPDED